MTPEGGIVSPLLWFIALSILFRTITGEGFDSLCYADDIVIFLKWGTRPMGLNVNPDKTKICIITRRTKIEGERVYPQSLYIHQFNLLYKWRYGTSEVRKS